MHQIGLVVFDLDFTLWDCGGTWCDCLSPPFEIRHNDVRDGTGRIVELYPSVPAILSQCHKLGVPMALASRTDQPSWARELLELLEISDHFGYAEIYPSSKQKHFTRIQQQSGIPLESMVFFDDEMRNIREVGAMGVHCVHVQDGMNQQLFSQTLQKLATY